jgi:hypothetical protein
LPPRPCRSPAASTGTPPHHVFRDERGKSVGLLLVRAPPYLRQAHAWHGHVDQVAALRELAGFLALAADGILVWGGGRVTRTTTTSAMRPWAGPPNDRFSSPVTRKPVVKHAIAAVAPKSTRWSMRMAGCPAGSPARSATTRTSASPPSRGEERSEK